MGSAATRLQGRDFPCYHSLRLWQGSDNLALARRLAAYCDTAVSQRDGLTFREWRRRARIMAAAEMLSSGSRPVKDVASRFGFSSTAAFGHVFREVMGMTPTEFQRRSVL